MITLDSFGGKINSLKCKISLRSTDVKPIDKINGKTIENGSECIEVDTGNEFIFDRETKTWNFKNSNAGDDDVVNIISFTATPSVCEMGSKNNIVTLDWQLTSPMGMALINETPVQGNSIQYTDVSEDTTYVLRVLTGSKSRLKSVSVSFANQIYYGAAEDLDSVTELDKVLSNTKTRTVTVNAGADQYIIYAVPVRLGTVRFFVNGFEGGFSDPEVMQLRNASNFTEPYNVYKSIRANLGVTTVEVKE